MELVQSDLLTPMVLAFVPGVAAARLGGELKRPDPIDPGLSIHPILAIGPEGGAALLEHVSVVRGHETL